MDIVIEDKIEATPEWSAAVLGANKLMETQIAKYAPRVSAAWDLVWVRDQFPGFRLRVSQDDATAEAQFTLAELKNGPRLRDQLHWLGGDLLQNLSHRQMARLRDTVQQLEGD